MICMSQPFDLNLKPLLLLCDSNQHYCDKPPPNQLGSSDKCLSCIKAAQTVALTLVLGPTWQPAIWQSLECRQAHDPKHNGISFAKPHLNMSSSHQ